VIGVPDPSCCEVLDFTDHIEAISPARFGWSSVKVSLSRPDRRPETGHLWRRDCDTLLPGLINEFLRGLLVTGDVFALQSRPVTTSIRPSEKAEPLLSSRQNLLPNSADFVANPSSQPVRLFGGLSLRMPLTPAHVRHALSIVATRTFSNNPRCTSSLRT